MAKVKKEDLAKSEKEAVEKVAKGNEEPKACKSMEERIEALEETLNAHITG